MPRSSRSKGGERIELGDSRPWLPAKVYGPKRSHSVELVRQSVDALLAAHEEVSLLSIVAMSKRLDPSGVGVAHTTILRNAGARSYYMEHRTWKGDRGTRQPRLEFGEKGEGGEVDDLHLKIDRDPDRARRRYMQQPKALLVARLMAAEQAYVTHREMWLQASEEILEWRLRAETAEKLLREREASGRGPEAAG